MLAIGAIVDLDGSSHVDRRSEWSNLWNPRNSLLRSRAASICRDAEHPGRGRSDEKLEQRPNPKGTSTIHT